MVNRLGAHELTADERRVIFEFDEAYRAEVAKHVEGMARRVRPGISPELRAIILGCLAAFIFGMVLYAMQNGWAL